MISKINLYKGIYVMNEKKRLEREYFRELFSSDISEEGKRRCQELVRRYKAEKKKRKVKEPYTPLINKYDFLYIDMYFWHPERYNGLDDKKEK